MVRAYCHVTQSPAVFKFKLNLNLNLNLKFTVPVTASGRASWSVKVHHWHDRHSSSCISLPCIWLTSLVSYVVLSAVSTHFVEPPMFGTLIQISIYESTKRFMMVRVNTLTFFHGYSESVHVVDKRKLEVQMGIWDILKVRFLLCEWRKV